MGVWSHDSAFLMNCTVTCTFDQHPNEWEIWYLEFSMEINKMIWNLWEDNTLNFNKSYFCYLKIQVKYNKSMECSIALNVQRNNVVKSYPKSLENQNIYESTLLAGFSHAFKWSEWTISIQLFLSTLQPCVLSTHIHLKLRPLENRSMLHVRIYAVQT